MKKALILVILFFMFVGCSEPSNINICPSLAGKTKIKLFAYDTCAWEVAFYLNQMLKCENDCNCEAEITQEKIIQKYMRGAKTCSLIRAKVSKTYE